MKDNTEESGILVLEKHFQNVDEHASAVKAWDLELYQLDCGAYAFTELSLISEEIQYTYLQSARRMLNRGSNRLPGFQFCFQLTEHRNPVNIGYDFDDPVIWCIPQGNGIESIFPNDFYGLTLYISQRLFYQCAEEWRLNTLNLLPSSEPTAFPLTDGQHRNLCNAFKALRHKATDRDLSAVITTAFSNDWLIAETRETILPLLFDVFANGTDWRFQARPPALLKAIRLIIENIDAPPGIEEIAKLVGTSPRNLQYLFRRHIGMTPKQFSRTFRLNVARKKISGSLKSRGAIYKTANELGYWHMGDFSHQFRKLFHCSPTELLLQE